MPAYFIACRESPVRDEAAMAEYKKGSASTPALAMTPLAVYGAIEALEGEAPDGVVILQFPTMADARAWYESPEYQARVGHRLRAADYRSFLVEGL